MAEFVEDPTPAEDEELAVLEDPALVGPDDNEIKFALDALTEAQALLSLTPTLQSVDYGAVYPTDTTGYDESLPDEPALSSDSAITITIPGYDQTVVLPECDVSNAPVLTAAPPILKEFDIPATFDKVAPVSPGLIGAAAPPEPPVAIPAAPALREIVLPEAPQLIDIEFAATAPLAPGATTVEFSYAEAPYASALLDNLNTKLGWFLDPLAFHGMADHVWQRLFEQAREPQDRETAKQMQATLAQFAGRGFRLPPGMALARIASLREERHRKSTDASRGVARERIKQEIEQLRLGITEGIRLEIQAQALHNEIQQRAFEVARFTVEAALSIYRALVSFYNAEVQAYRTEAQVYRSLIEAELLKLERFKAEIEAAKTLSTVNQQEVAVYRERINAVTALFDLYKSRLEGAKFTLEQNRQSIDLYKAEVESFAAKSQATSLRAKAYESEVEVESLKVDNYAAQAKAFRSEVEAYSDTVQAKAKCKQADVAAARFDFDVFEARVNGFEAKVNALSKEARAIAQRYDARLSKSAASIEGAADMDYANAGLYAAKLQEAIIVLEQSIGVARANVDHAIQQASIIADKIQGYADVAGQIAMAALAQFNRRTTTSYDKAYSHSETHPVGDTQTIDYITRHSE